MAGIGRASRDGGGRNDERTMAELIGALFQPPPPEDVVTLPVAIFALLCLVGFVASVLLTREDAVSVAARVGDPVVVRRHADVLSWLFGAGLFFLGIRLLQVNPLAFGAPIWLLVCVMAIVGYAWRVVVGRRSLAAK
jgi:hypothetical protein